VCGWKQQLTIYSSEADEVSDKNQDEQDPAASPEEQPVVPHGSTHQPTAMGTVREKLPPGQQVKTDLLQTTPIFPPTPIKL